jgi:hypothetical protein
MGPLGSFAAEQKLSGVVRIAEPVWSEEGHGYQNEHLTEEFACRGASGEARWMKVYWIMRTKGRRSPQVLNDQVISDAEYDAFREQHGVLDSPAYHAAVNSRRELLAQLNTLTPTCPTCRNQMVLRNGSYGEFWGCENYPHCKGTKRVVPSEKSERDRVLEALTALQGDSF